LAGPGQFYWLWLSFKLYVVVAAAGPATGERPGCLQERACASRRRLSDDTVLHAPPRPSDENIDLPTPLWTSASTSFITRAKKVLLVELVKMPKQWNLKSWFARF